MSGPKQRKEMYTQADAYEKNKLEKGVLYLVATPIGNLADLSQRALKVLGEVDFIAAEDTRNTLKLLTYFGISKPLVSYYQHNRTERGAVICERLKNGESCALVTDAGTPAISDPGEDLVRLCAENGIKVTFVPGACAAIGALALSGLFTGRFVFEGFLSGARNERRERLAALENEERTMILYEAPHHLKNTLSDLKDAFGGDRRITLCREMTKLNEEIIRTTVDGAIELLAQTAPRGEYVLVLEGNTKPKAPDEFWQSMTVRHHVEHYIALGMDKNTAIKKAAHDRGVHKNAVYQEMLNDNE